MSVEAKAPPKRLTQDEIERIRRLKSNGTSTKAIARAIGRPPISVRRALRRLALGETLAAGDDARRRVAVAVIAAAARRRGLCPAGIVSEPGSVAWFEENEASFRAGLARARAAAGIEIGPVTPASQVASREEGGAQIVSGCPPRESRGMAPVNRFEVTKMLAQIADPIPALGELRSPELVLEVGYALGSEATGQRVREILRSPIARLRPAAAIDLATRSSLPAEEVLALLARMPPESGGDPTPTGTVTPVGGGGGDREGV